jgi:hypothetical protein
VTDWLCGLLNVGFAFCPATVANENAAPPMLKLPVTSAGTLAICRVSLPKLVVL